MPPAAPHALTRPPLADDLTAEPDALLPFLIAIRAADPSNPNEKEARGADRAARAAYRELLDGRSALIGRRLDEERERLLRKQQAFARAREHTEAEESAFEARVGEATFTIAILEGRLARAQAAKASKAAAFEAKLAADPRLLPVYAPAEYAAKLAAVAVAAAEAEGRAPEGGE